MKTVDKPCVLYSTECLRQPVSNHFISRLVLEFDDAVLALFAEKVKLDFNMLGSRVTTGLVANVTRILMSPKL